MKNAIFMSSMNRTLPFRIFAANLLNLTTGGGLRLDSFIKHWQDSPNVECTIGRNPPARSSCALKHVLPGGRPGAKRGRVKEEALVDRSTGRR